MVWPKGSFEFFSNMLWKTQTNFLANLIYPEIESTFHEFTAKPLDSNQYHHFLGAATVISSLVSLIRPCIISSEYFTAIRLTRACNIIQTPLTHLPMSFLLTHSKKLKSLHQPRRPFLDLACHSFLRTYLCFLTLHPKPSCSSITPTRLAPAQSLDWWFPFLNMIST